MPLTQQKHYTVGYHDTELHHFEICEYAADSYQAIQYSKEDVPYLQEHPHFVDYCVSEEVKKVEFISPSNLREDAEQTCKALYGVSDVRQLTRLWN